MLPKSVPSRSTIGLVALALLLGSVRTVAVTMDSTTREAGIPEVRAFGVRDYEKHNQTWGVTQDAAGVLYVGNKDVVLSYDGQAWQSIPTGGSFMRGVDVDADDRIWIGGVDEFGYLEADGLGGRRYVSLKAHLPTGLPASLEIFFMRATSHGVYLIAIDRILRWHNGQMSTLIEARIRTWQEGDELFVHAPNLPLRAFNGETWRTIAPADAIPDQTIGGSAVLPNGTRLLFTLRDGAYQLREGKVTPWPNEANELMREKRVVSSLQLHDGVIAVLLGLHGTVLLSPSGELIEFLDASNDTLPVATSLNLYEDKDRGLWISQNSGLARINRRHGTTSFDRRRGLGTNTVKAIRRHAGRLYVGTGDKLFVLRPQEKDTLIPSAAHFVPVEGADLSVWALTTAGDELLIGGREGLRTIGPHDETAQLALETPFISALLTSRENFGVVWSGNYDNLDLLHRVDGRWTVARTFSEVAGLVRSLAEDADGSIWAGVDGTGYFRISRPADARSDDAAAWQVEHYFSGHGLPAEGVDALPNVTDRDGRAVFLVKGQLFEFDSSTRMFVPLRTGLPQYGPGNRHVSLAPGLGGSMWIRTVSEEAESGPWQGRIYWQWQPDGSVRALPFALADRVGENPMFFEEETAIGSVLWVGGSEGLVRAPLPESFLAPKSFATRISQVRLRTGERLALAPDSPLQLPANTHGITFQFATSRVDDPGMRFQTRWDHSDDDWSPLSRVTELTIDRLPAGDHALEVRARDTNGRLGSPARYTFAVLPPWWQTWWARSLFGCAFVGVAVLVQRRRLRAVERRNQVLTQLVDHRTRELRRNENELIAARDAADSANRAKSEFLASMSHELRTPLNAILGFAHLLHRDTGLSTKSRQQLDIIDRNGRHLLGMINEVLDLAKIEAGKLTLNPTPCSLGQMAHELAEMFEPRAQLKGLIFRIELHHQTPRVLADAAKLRQVLINLLANAIKFTREGEVLLSLHQNADRFRFAVCDTGIGIAPEAQGSVFDPFHQMGGASSHDASEADGTGLGLPISQNLIGLMGGHIELESEPGVGSCFRFELVLPAAPQSAGASPLPTSVTGYRGPRRHLLIVDDVATNRELLHETLAPLGFDLTTVDSGEAAIEAQERRPAELVLLDLRLPGISGVALTTRLRAITPHPLPIIAVSASVLELNHTRAAEFGCDAFVAKPVREQVLLDEIAAQLHLKWITKVGAPAPSPAPSPSPVKSDDEVVALPLPSPELLQTWLELARRSDQQTLRRLIDAADATGPDAPFRREMDQRLQRFRTGEVTRILTLALARTPGASPASP